MKYKTSNRWPERNLETFFDNWSEKRCGSHKFVHKLQDKLTKIARVGKGGLYFHSRAYELVYSSKNMIKLYSFMYPTLDVPCLKRKRNILIAGLKAFNMGP